MANWKGFSGLRTYSNPLQRDLRELERYLADVDERLAGFTKGETIYETRITQIELPPGDDVGGLGPHAKTHATTRSAVSGSGSDPLDVYEFDWKRSQKIELDTSVGATASDVCLTVKTSGTGHTGDLFQFFDKDGNIVYKQTAAGNLGINESTPLARLHLTDDVSYPIRIDRDGSKFCDIGIELAGTDALVFRTNDTGTGSKIGVLNPSGDGDRQCRITVDEGGGIDARVRFEALPNTGTNGDAPYVGGWFEFLDAIRIYPNDGGTGNDFIDIYTDTAGQVNITAKASGAGDAAFKLRNQDDQDDELIIKVGSPSGDVDFFCTGVYTFDKDVNVPDEAYAAGWDGSTEVPTKNAIYDRLADLFGSGAALPAAPSELRFFLKTGPPDELYFSGQITGGTWVWSPLAFLP